MHRILFAVLASLLVVGCASSSNMVLTPNQSQYRTDTVKLEYGGGTVEVEEASVTELQRYMREEFFERTPIFSPGEGLTVRYGFYTFDEGNQAARYFLGGIGGGEAEMVVRAQFIDPQGNVLAETQATGRVSGGFFGGDAGSAFRNVAKELAAYAEATFAQ